MYKWRGSRIVILTLPDSLRTEIDAFAELNHRTRKAEILSTLQEKYTGQITAEARLSVLNSLLRKMARDGGPSVINSSAYQIICQIRDDLEDNFGTV